jgi:hypothetical protein
LASLLADMGELAAALALYEEVVLGKTAQLGAGHTSTLRTKSNLATVLKDMDELASARALCEEVVAGLTEQLGAGHTSTLTAKAGLANLLKDMGEWATTWAMYEEVVVGETEQLGAGHTSTLHTKSNLALLLQRMGEWAPARALYEEVVAGRTEQLGAGHTSTLITKYNMAILLADMEEWSSAWGLYEECVEGFAATYGPEHEHAVNAWRATQMLAEETVDEQSHVEQVLFLRNEERADPSRPRRPATFYVLSVPGGGEIAKRFSDFDALRVALVEAEFPGARATKLPTKLWTSVAKRTVALPACLNALCESIGGGLATAPAAAPLRKFLAARP